MACLSSRIPHGEAVTPEKLGMVEQGENVLRDLGFYDVRVRHHELKSGQLARIEVGRDELGKLCSPSVLSTVSEAFRKIGYSHTTLDLEGYRRGSLNPVGAATGAAQ
jgi:uncharacterized protein